MSNFGWGVTDFLNLIKDVWSIAEAIRKGPAKYQELCRTADSLYRSLEELKRNVLESDQRWNPKAQARLDSLRVIIDNCSLSLGETWEFLARNRLVTLPKVAFSQKVQSMVSRYKAGMINEGDVRIKLMSHQQAINTFLQSFNHGTLQQMDQRLARMESNSMASNFGNPPQIQSHFYQPQFNYQPTFSPPLPLMGPAYRAICDGCDHTIYEIRYRCLNCADFDYCHNCIRNARNTHNSRHNFQLLHDC